MVVKERQAYNQEAMAEIPWGLVSRLYGQGEERDEALFFRAVCNTRDCPLPYDACRRTDWQNCYYLSLISKVLQDYRRQTDYSTVLTFVDHLRRNGT